MYFKACWSHDTYLWPLKTNGIKKIVHRFPRRWLITNNYMIHPKFTGTIQNGTLTLENPDRFKKYLSSLKAKKVSMTVKPHRKIRTTGKLDEPSNQNGYLWGAVYPVLCDYFGYTPDEMHQAIKHKFLRIGGTDELPKIKSTSKLSRLEWEDLMEKIRVWALTDYSINIPSVEDYYDQ